MQGLDEMQMGADMESWDKMLNGQREVQQVEPSLDPAVYAACFNTEAGQMVLADLYSRYVNVTIVEPGQPPETHGIRQGQANVVFDIVDLINRMDDGDENV